jgi:ectoine hydroxylase-related dioxygenase (phytanoyl-CoA dioxygenase family)
MSTLSAVEEHGFFILPDLISPQDVKRLTADLGHSVLRRSKAGVRHALSHPVVAALASDVRMLNIAQEILGAGALPFRATLFCKSAEANWLVVWHQDTALPLRERRDTPGWGPWSVKDGVVYAHAPARALCGVLALRVHLDDCDARNGPLKVLPGTHKRGVLTDDEITEHAAQIAQVECLVPQGGILAMRPLLIHASSKSQSETPRRVLHIEYAASRIVDTCLELAVA